MTDFLAAAAIVFSFDALLLLFLGAFAGVVIGALPGLTVNMGIALLLPLTFSFQGMAGILMLLACIAGPSTAARSPPF